MMLGFRELTIENRGEFLKKIEKDIKKLADGTILYAFLPDFFSSMEKHSYLKLKVLKDVDSAKFIGFLCYIENDDEILTKISPKNVFLSIRDRSDENSTVGYCLNKIEAEAVKLLSIKKDIDLYCNTLGYDNVMEFYDQLNSFKLHNPEKFI